MTVLPQRPRIAIVGAGAAGIGAGLELRARGVEFVILEASGRIGGRAYTDRTSLPALWDQGCGWLHCADINPLVAHAERLGAKVLREARTDHIALHRGGRWADAPERAAMRAALAAVFDAIDAAAQGEDVAVASLMDPGAPWAEAVRCLVTLTSGDVPEALSAAAEADYQDTGVNWPLATGYGDLIERMGAGLPIRTGVPVSRVAQDGAGARLTTAQGELRVDAALITAGFGVLTGGGLEVGPGPARDALDLAAHVPMGAYEKVALALTRLPFDEAGKLFCMVMPDGGAPVDFQILRSDPPLMVAHVHAEPVRALAPEGREALIAFAKERFAQAFGAQAAKLITGAACSGWLADPLFRGCYTHVAPGHAQDRRDLIARDTGPIAFAGEALSLRWQATAHGAYASGRAVAARLAEALPPA